MVIIGKNLTGAKGVQYLPRQWCVMDPSASVPDPNFGLSIEYACTYADCTSLSTGSSCGGMDPRAKASYAFNQYFQVMNQQDGSCEKFHNLSIITKMDPGSQGGSCRYEIMVDPNMQHENNPGNSSDGKMNSPIFLALVLVLIAIACYLD